MPSQSAIWFETTAKRFGGWQDCVQHLSRSRQIGGQRMGIEGNRPALQAGGSTGNDRETTGTDGARRLHWGAAERTPILFVSC